ncbi:MAG: diguanylate cyclase [Aliarcobacter sp.]|nr:diguanylate cyclase [Aliarcobacter sp.]
MLSAVYVLLGILSMKYVTMSSGIAIAWLPNSLLLAFFLIKDKKEWKYYIPFFVLAEIIADYPAFSIIQALQFAFINIFETTVAAYLIKRFSGNQKINFSSTKYVIGFFLIGLNIMPMLSGILGATVYSTQIDQNTTFFEFWRLWYFGDAVGILLLTPIMVILKENYNSLKEYNFDILNIFAIVLTLYLSIELFSTNNIIFSLPATPFILILPLVWIVYKQKILPALIVSFLISIIAIYFTLNGTGPFSIFAQKETTIYLQEFISLLLTITIFIGALLKEINDSKEEVIKLNKNLEDKIKEKTQSLVDANEKLIQLASLDPLTNIYNRRMIDEYISKETVKSKRYKNDLSLIILDIDHFKETNDKYGHQVGDEIIVEICKIISRNIRESDIFGRWGGEEFIILLPQTNLDSAFIVAENLRKKIENYNFRKVGTKTISIGISQFNNNENIFQFIKRADDAMYKAKNSGRNKIAS